MASIGADWAKMERVAPQKIYSMVRTYPANLIVALAASPLATAGRVQISSRRGGADLGPVAGVLSGLAERRRRGVSGASLS